MAGFLGGSEHDGTFRVRPARDGTRLLAAGQELIAEPDAGTAYLQGLLA